MRIRHVLALMVPALLSCLGPSKERVECVQRCAVVNDGCLIGASNAGDIQACSENATACARECPAR